MSIDQSETSPYIDRQQVPMIWGAAPASEQFGLSVVKSTAGAHLEAPSVKFIPQQWLQILQMIYIIDAHEWQDLDQCHFNFI